ncbi:MAG: hypothetical protein AUJ52_10450 [Elusimicrobia bacterium CG1_02_63_36]|nr:MAG: hypothetical protein AUJ52_10450 [Elusimicrobia bacterium CG1_02_63_36]
MSALYAALLFASGAFTGTLGAILGLGGGVFLVPALVLGFGVPIRDAAAAGLVAVIATSSAAAAVNTGRGLVNIRLGMVLETATVSGAVAGGVAAAFLPARVIIGVFGALLAAVTVLLWREPAAHDPDAADSDGLFPDEYHDPSLGRTVRYSVRRIGAAMGTAFFAGNLSGLLGVGGGVVKVPVLHLFCGMPIKAAAATSNFMIGVTGAAGAVTYAMHGGLDSSLCGIVALGVLSGSTAGARIAPHLPARAIRRVFALLTLLLSIQMLRRSLGL